MFLLDAKSVTQMVANIPAEFLRWQKISEERASRLARGGFTHVNCDQDAVWVFSRRLGLPLKATMSAPLGMGIGDSALVGSCDRRSLQDWEPVPQDVKIEWYVYILR